MVQEALVVQEAVAVLDQAELTQEVHPQAQLEVELKIEEVVVLVDLQVVVVANLVAGVAVELWWLRTTRQILCP
jgi:hypothetical protein